MARGQLFSSYTKQIEKHYHRMAQYGVCAVYKQWTAQPKHSPRLYEITSAGQLLLVCKDCKLDLERLNAFMETMQGENWWKTTGKAV